MLAMKSSPGQSQSRPWRSGLEVPLASVVIILVLLGSLTPFSMDAGRPGAFHASAIGWPRPNVADVLVNLAIYLPVGASLVLAARARTSAGVAVLIAVLGSASLSLFVETMQTAIAGRYPSWFDVELNVLGGCGGAIAAALLAGALGRRLLAFHDFCRRNPKRVLAPAVTGLVLCAGLLPVWLVWDTPELHARFRDAHIPLVATALAGRLVPAGPPNHAAWQETFVDMNAILAVVFAALGCVHASTATRYGTKPGAAFLEALGAGWLLAVIIETMQLFDRMHAYELAAIAVNGTAATLGAALVALRSWRRASARRGEAPRPAPTWSVVMFWLAIVATVVGKPLLRAATGGATRSSGHMNWIAFQDYLTQPFLVAMIDLGKLMITVALLSVAATMVCRRMQGARAWMSLVLVLGPMLAAQPVAALLGQNASVSDPLFALLGWLIASRAIAVFARPPLHTSPWPLDR